MKKRYFLFASILSLSLYTTGCSISGIELPSNAQVIESSSGARYLGAVDFSYTSKQLYNFSQIRLCVAQNVSNSHVTLHDSSGSWVGPYTGTYYQRDNRQQVAGSANIFKLIDEKNSTLIASGTTNATASSMLMPMTDIIKYEVMVSVQGNQVKILFNNITRAWQDTGGVVNDGFQPVGLWQGTRADNVYHGIEAIAQRIRACAP